MDLDISAAVRLRQLQVLSTNHLQSAENTQSDVSTGTMEYYGAHTSPYGIRRVACGIRQVRGNPRSSLVSTKPLTPQCIAAYLRKSKILRSVLLWQTPPKLAVLYRNCECVVRQRKSPHAPIQAETGPTFRLLELI